MTHPRLASFVAEDHAASDLITNASGGICGGEGRCLVLVMVSLTSVFHSLASLMAEVRVSSGEAECPSKTYLFRSFHSNHRTQGTRVPEVRPAGGDT